MSYNKHTWVNNVDAVDEDKMNNIENGIANAVEKTGDTLTGELFFENTDGYGAITKYRTVSGTNYSLALGLGANGATRLENRGGANNISLEVRADGIYNGSSGNKLMESKSEIVYSNWHSVVLTRSDQTNLLVMLYGSNQLKTGTYSVANNFKLVCYGTNYAELTIPKSAITNIVRFDWGFELVINRSQISGNPSGELNGTAVVYDGPLTLRST